MNIQPEWIVGFVDGEGCFHVAINQNKTMKYKVQVLPEFTVVQHKKNIKILYALKTYFKCGVVRRNHKDRYCFRVRTFQHLQEIIIPFFEKYRLLTTKRVDFQKFRKVVILMERQLHLEEKGIQEILKIKNTMNKNIDIVCCF